MNEDEMELPIMGLRQIVMELAACGFTCEAGPLENNLAFRSLQRWASYEVKGFKTVEIDLHGSYIIQVPQSASAEEVAHFTHKMKLLVKGEIDFLVTKTPVRVVRLERPLDVIDPEFIE